MKSGNTIEGCFAHFPPFGGRLLDGTSVQGCNRLLMPTIHGHTDQIKTLQQAMEGDRLHHAWIFSGPVGVGKRTAATELGRILLDDGVSADDLGSQPPALLSESGALLMAGSHPDLHCLQKEDAAYSDNRNLRERKQLNIPLDLLRERVIGGRTSDNKSHDAAVYRTAAMGGSKVFIIDEAELLDRTAQNILLKTLEEPPKGTFIILVTSRPEQLISTIRSRCQHLRFGTLDETAMTAWISENEPTIDAGDLEWLTHWSEGAPGRFKTAVKHDLSTWAKTLQPMLDRADAGEWQPELGATMIELIEQFAELVLADNPKASKEAANREGLRQLLRLLGQHLRRRLADGTNQLDCCATIDLLSEIERQSESHLNLKQLMESLSAGWASPDHTPTP